MNRTKTAHGHLRIKDAAEGTFEAVFATLNVVDLDGDLLKATSFTEGQAVVISAYGHASHPHLARLPVGKGRIEVRDDTAVVVGKFFLDTTDGRDTWTVVKSLFDDETGESLQEWSFNLRDVEEHKETLDGKRVNVIDSVRVKEACPVLEGSGIDTRTLIAKAKASEDVKQAASDLERQLRSAGQELWSSDDVYVWLEDWDVDTNTAVFSVYDDGETLMSVEFTRESNAVTLSDEIVEVARVVTYAPKSGQRFVEQTKSVVSEVRALVERAAQVVSMRSAQGNAPLSGKSVEVLTDLDTSLDKLRELLSEPAAPAPVDPSFATADAMLAIAEMEVSLS